MALFKEKCDDTVSTPVVKLLDPLKMKVTGCRKDAVAVVQEMDDGTFRLNNVFLQPLCGPKFDIACPAGYANIMIITGWS